MKYEIAHMAGILTGIIVGTLLICMVISKSFDFALAVAF